MIKRKFTLLTIVWLFAGLFAATAQPTEFSGQAPVPGAVNSLRTGPVLYDQISNPSTGYIASTEFTDAANLDFTCQAADDFIVPAGETWNIGKIGVAGWIWYGHVGTYDSLNVYFYNDDNGMPGTLAHSFEDVTEFTVVYDTINGSVSSYYEVGFDTPLTFTEGTYWLSFNVISDYDVDGQWGWQQEANSPHLNNMFHWQNPGNGFGNGFTTWTPANIVVFFGYFDLSFVLFDQPFNDDMAVLEFVGPQNAPGLTNAETITMKIKNEGSDVQTGFDVSYTINGGTPVVENVGSLSLNPEEIVDYSFTTPADFSVSGIYDVEVAVALSGDEFTENDMVPTQVVNYGTVYEMTDGVDITACSGTFTDPGGLCCNFGQNDIATMTIYPDTPGNMVRLNFIFFDVYWSEFYLYDGEDTDAPLIGFYESTFSPGIVTALNPSGAITIHFEAPGWDDGIGWEAIISCYDQPDDDFGFTDFSRNTYTIYTEQTFTLSATVRNLGAIAQDKDVMFYMDGNVIGTVNTGLVNSTEYATVTLDVSVSTPGPHLAEVSIPADDGDDPENDHAEMAFDSYLEDAFVQFFEDPIFPPDFWSTNNWQWQTSSGFPFNGQGCAQSYVGWGATDTLFAPVLEINPGDMLTFWAQSSLWWPGKIKVMYEDANTGTWTLLQDIAPELTFYSQYEVDLTLAAGNNRLAFVAWFDDPWAWGGQVTIDDIIGDPFLYFVDDDLTAFELDGTTTPSVNEPAAFTVKVRNIGALDQPQGAYTVNLMQVDAGGDILLQSKPGNTITHLEEQTYAFNYAFSASGEYDIYAEVVLPGDMQPENNISVGKHLFVQVSGTVKVDIGEGEDEGYYLPMRTDIPYGLSQTIYNSSTFTETGAITGISYYYNNNGYQDVIGVPIRAWIGTTTDNTTVDSVYTHAGDMDFIIQDTVDFLMGEHELFLPFSQPMIYDGTDNVEILFSKDSSGWMGLVYFKTSYTDNDDSVSLWANQYQPAINPYRPDTSVITPHPVNRFPNSTFFVNTAGLGELGGTVFDQNGNPFPGVLVTMDGYPSVNAITDANGEYFFNEIIAGDQSFTATIFEYEDNSQPIGVQNGFFNQLDFTMVPKPLVNISGTVVADDDPQHYLEDALVRIDGYFIFTDATDDMGEFMLPGVYGNETYTITVSLDGYETYVDNNVVVGNAPTLDLGTITLVEIQEIAFFAQAAESYEEVNISWNEPKTGMEEMYEYDLPDHPNNGWTNEPYEHVWLGNIYNTTDKGTITTVDIRFVDYWVYSDYLTLDIIDADGNIVMSSEPFMTIPEGWLTVDVPNVAFEGTFYAMIHYQDNENSVDMMAYWGDEPGAHAANNAYIMYPGDDQPELLSGWVGTEGTFYMKINAIVEDETRSFGSRYIESYDIYKGLLSDVANAGSWAALNTDPVTETTFIDNEWPPAVVDQYVYGIVTHYTNGESEMSFSNPVSNVAPEFVSEPVTSALVSVEYTYDVEVEDLNIDDQIVITADEIPAWLAILDNGDGTALLSGTPTEIGEYNVKLKATDGQLEDLQEFVISATPVGIDENETNAIMVYPNPAVKQLNITYNGEATAYIYNSYGQVVGAFELKDQNNVIDVSGLTSGVYIITINNDDEVITRRFNKL